MQRSLECCLGAIAGLAKMHAPLQALSKAHNILAFYPGKFLGSKVVHWNLARSCVAKAQLTQDKLESRELGGGGGRGVNGRCCKQQLSTHQLLTTCSTCLVPVFGTSVKVKCTYCCMCRQLHRHDYMDEQCAQQPDQHLSAGSFCCPAHLPLQSLPLL